MNQINYINKIIWINLDISIDRRNYMENLLKDVTIENIRINGIDAKKYDNIRNIINIDLERELTNYEIAVSLSHIKAINSLNFYNGEYFMVCEDDISFDNLKYFNETLEDIIKNSPTFDLLMLYKTSCNETNDLYSDWIEYYNKGIHLYGACCYIISRNGVNRMNELCQYIDDNNFVFNKNIKLNMSEYFLFKNLKTYCYKYNYIGITCGDSTIQSDLSFHRLSNEFQLELIKNR